jgi:hypothetical protein
MKARTLPSSFSDRLKEIDMFFQGKDPVYQTLRRVVKRLEKAGIAYALMGGMAVNSHRYHRTTNDVDILLTANSLAEFKRLFVPKFYQPVPGRPRRYLDRKNKVSVDILVTGHYPGSGKPGPLAFPDPARVAQKIDMFQVIDLPTLIQLKLAARRHRDFGDVVELIRVHGLDEAYQDRLHPSVHRDFLECLEEKRREDEYEARGD